MAAASTCGTASTPFCEVPFAIHWARALTARLGLFLHVGVVAFSASELCLASDNEGLGLGAVSTEVASGVCNLGIACAVIGPTANARNWASRLLTLHLAWISAIVRHRRAVLALRTTMLGRFDLNPLAVLPDHLVVAVAAVGIAFTILGPFAHSRNWAWHGLWVTRPDLHLANVVTLLASMLGMLSDLEPASLITIRTAWFSARLPWEPVTDTGNRAWVLVAHLMLHSSSLVRTFLSTMFSRLCHNESGLLGATPTLFTALTEFGPVAFAVHRAGCFATICFVNSSIRGGAAFTAAFLFDFHSELPALGAPSAASDFTITITLEPLEVVTSTLAPFSPSTLAINCAARQLA